MILPNVSGAQKLLVQTIRLMMEEKHRRKPKDLQRNQTGELSELTHTHTSEDTHTLTWLRQQA